MFRFVEYLELCLYLQGAQDTPEYWNFGFAEVMKKASKKHMMTGSMVPAKNKLFPSKVVPSKVRLKLNLNILQKFLPNNKSDSCKKHLSSPLPEKLNQSNDFPLTLPAVSKVSSKKKKPRKQKQRPELKLDPQNSVTIPNKTDDGSEKNAEIEDSPKMNTERNDERARKRETFQQEAKERLKAAQFRMINEKLYTSTGAESFEYFQQEDPYSYNLYHEGYRQQVTKWPVDPLDVIMERIKKMSLKNSKVIADLGCGEARLAQVLGDSKRTVHSFDLKALNDRVTECDMAKVPLKRGTVDVAVFCLSLMGTNLNEYLLSAARILKIGGCLKIAEVQSRFDDLKGFVKSLKLVGFKFVKQEDLSNGYFVLLEFIKKKEHPEKTKLPNITLNPCLYKKR